MLNRRQCLAGLALGTASVLPFARAALDSRASWRGRHVIDGLCGLLDLDDATGAQPLGEGDLAAVRDSGLTAINFTTPAPGDDAGETLRKIELLESIIHSHPGALELVLDTAGLERCRESGHLGVIIGFQSTEMFSAGLGEIDRFHAAGARIMQMSYNGPGLFGHGCLSEGDAGLTPLGREALERMQALGVLVDLSHANRATTAQGIAAARRPVALSHTGCNAVHRHPRNNDDAELRALAGQGGVVGIYLMPFLDGGSGELDADMLFAHLEHALDVCGSEHVGIGSDQGMRPVADGPEYRARLRAEVEARRAAGISAPGESPDRPPFIPEFNRPDRLLAIAEAMAQRGHPERVIENVIGGNFARLLQDAWS